MPSPSDQAILDALRTAYYQLAVSGAKEYTILGRTFVRQEIHSLRQEIEIWERRIDAATQPGISGGTLLVGFR